MTSFSIAMESEIEFGSISLEGRLGSHSIFFSSSWKRDKKGLTPPVVFVICRARVDMKDAGREPAQPLRWQADLRSHRETGLLVTLATYGAPLTLSGNMPTVRWGGTCGAGVCLTCALHQRSLMVRCFK